jgi:lysophospholipase L1-like esterase
LSFIKNGVLAGIASVEPGGTLYPILSFANNSDSATANFGATEMNFLPAGATSWDGILTSGGRHAATSQILPALQQISGAVGAAPAILNPNDKSVNLSLSNGNLTVISNSANGMVRGTRPGVANRYFEFTFSSIGGGGVGIGVANLTQSLAGYMGDPNGVGYFSTGYSEWPASGFDDVFATFTAGDVIGVHLKASTVDFYKNGTLAGTATALPSGVLYPAVLLVSTGDRGTVNFGASSFLSLPAGATAWSASISSSDHTALVTQILGSLGQTITATTGTGGTAGITLNPADKFTDIVLSNANLRATYTTSRPSENVNVRGNTAGGPDNYFEVVFSTLVSSTSGAGIGVANLSQSLSAYPGDPNGVGWYISGYTEWPGSGYSNNFGSFAAGDVLGVCLRSSSVEFYKNGTLAGTATALPTGALYPVISPANNTDSATVNFGASAFSFAPSGALPWGHFNVGGYVCDGDSLTRGAAQDGVPVVSYPTQLAGITSLPVANMGIDGQSMATMDANYAANIAPLFNASTANVLILEGGGNDLPGGGTATTIGASVRSYCAKARATGFKVFLMTMPPININNDARIDAINADRRSTWASYCDGLIDIAADPAFSDVGNRTYYQTDNTHWRTAADTVVANLVKVATLGP